MNAGLTMWQTVLQSQAIHLDWTPEIHLGYLEQEGFDTATLTGGTSTEVITRWLAQNIESGALLRTWAAAGVEVARQPCGTLHPAADPGWCPRCAQQAAS